MRGSSHTQLPCAPRQTESPREVACSNLCEDCVMSRRSGRYPAELKERAVRMVFDHQPVAVEGDLFDR